MPIQHKIDAINYYTPFKNMKLVSNTFGIAVEQFDSIEDILSLNDCYYQYI